MANTVNITTNINITSLGPKIGLNESAVWNTTSSLYTVENQPVSASFVQLSSSLSPYDVYAVSNNDLTSSVTLSLDASGSNIISVIPPQPSVCVVLQGFNGPIYAKSSPSASLVSVVGSPE